MSNSFRKVNFPSTNPGDRRYPPLWERKAQASQCCCLTHSIVLTCQCHDL
ncbi:hypothetical protein H6G45_02370 [Synechocystis sp. FACHB-383]|nr:hypothetical protein [Synechocystis sp. FACHB-383]MBD2652356.1 hypothetical protein [Synechocystis sp. FACHB-383]